MEKTELRGLSQFAGRTRREINRHDAEPAEANLQVATLVIKLRRAKATHNRIRLMAGIDRDATVTFSDCILVIAVVTLGSKTPVDELMLLRFGFLDTDDIGLLCVKPLEKALARCSANSVYVGTDYPKQI
jgi:hypothetical protein